MPRFKHYWNNLRNNDEIRDKYEQISEPFANAFFDEFNPGEMELCWTAMESEAQEKMFDEMMKDFKTFRLVPAVEKILQK